jgi:hypothetical protein
LAYYYYMDNIYNKDEMARDAYRVIINDKNKYIEQVNKSDSSFPITVWSHFICGIPNSDLSNDVNIEGYNLLDFDKPIPMLFYAFDQCYFDIEEHHFTDDYKSIRKNNCFIKHNLMYMVYKMRFVSEPNIFYSLADEHEKYRIYDMDLDEIFHEEKLYDYMIQLKRNNINFTSYHLPVIKGFRLSVDTKYNAIKCEILLLE